MQLLHNRRLNKSVLTEAFVSRRTVQTWNRKIEQSQVDSQLGPMVHQVIQEHCSIKHFTRPIHNDLPTEGELPIFIQIVI